MDGFPIYKYIILDHNMGLAKRVAVTIVHILQRGFVNFDGIVNKVAKGVTLGIIGICLDPTTVRC
jgi:hypothetical protein